MRIRTVLTPWDDFRTDSSRLVEAVSLIHEHLGNVPWFIGGTEAIDVYMDEDPQYDPPHDIGLGVVLTIPDPPQLREHLDLERRESPPWTGPSHDQACAARHVVQASKILKQKPPPEAATLLAAWEATHLSWNIARREQEERQAEVAREIEDYVSDQVDAAVHPLRRKLRELLEAQDVPAHIKEYAPQGTSTLRKLGWMPDVIPPYGEVSSPEVSP